MAALRGFEPRPDGWAPTALSQNPRLILFKSHLLEQFLESRVRAQVVKLR